MTLTKKMTDSSGNHKVHICLSENSQADLVTSYIKKGLLKGEGIFVIAKRELGKNLRGKIDGLSFDGQALQDSNQVRFFDAQVLILHLKSDDGLEETVFHDNLITPIKKAEIKYGKTRAFIQMVDILWKQGQHDLLMQFIDYYRDLANTGSSTLCTYTLDHLAPESYEQALEHIFIYHSDLTPQKDNGSVEQGAAEASNLFEIAWNQVINKSVN